MAISRRRFLAQSSAVGAAASFGLRSTVPAAAPTRRSPSRSPPGHRPGSIRSRPGLTGGDNWAIRQIFDTLAKPEDGTFGVRPEDFRPSLAESWETLRGRQGLDLQASPRRQVSQGLRRDDVGRRRLHLRPASRSEDRHQPEAALFQHRIGRGAGPLHGPLHPQAA